MSRCFPFPPPGYEAKPKTKSEHGDLLKKEKRNKKKHKKEKRDRGQGERKEKDQGHRKDKCNNKKHKRGKHKDRRKNQEIEKEKKQFVEQETRKNDYLGNRSGTVKDSKPTDELVTQITYQKGNANHTLSSTSKLSPRSIECSVVVSSKEKERTFLSRVAEKSGQIAQRNHASEKGKDSGYGSNTRIQNGKSLQVGSAEKHCTRKHDSNGPGLRRVTTLVTQQNGRSTPSPNSFERIKARKHSDGCSHYVNAKGDNMGARGMMKKENGSANNFHTRMDQQQVRGKDERVEVKAKIKDVKANHHKVVKGSARDHSVNLKGVEDRDGDVKKRKARGKKKNKEEENGVPNELKQKGLDAHEARKNNARDIMDLDHLNDKLTSNDVKKRKDLEAISSLHEHSMRMTKLPRTSPANHPCSNGETLNHSQGTAHYSSIVPVGTELCETDRLQDSKECYNNGITGPHNLEEHATSISSCSYEYDSNKAFLTPPHPDTKYLNQVYSVPAIDDCLEYIDQDWLFCEGHVHQNAAISEAAESPQVWAEARTIDSADIVALPYIVPF